MDVTEIRNTDKNIEIVEKSERGRETEIWKIGSSSSGKYLQDVYITISKRGDKACLVSSNLLEKQPVG